MAIPPPIKSCAFCRENFISRHKQKFCSLFCAFEKHVNRSAVEGECWLWTGDKTQGYGKFRFEGPQYHATHLSLHYATGKPLQDIPFVCHTCDTPSCVNPAHLWIGDHLQNDQDKRSKGRAASCQGIHNPAVILDPDTVLAIYRATGNSQTIADRFNTTKSSVKNIKCGWTWAHLTKHNCSRGKYKQDRPKPRNYRLTEQDVLEIMKSTESINSLKNKYNVSRSTIVSLLLGYSWNNVTGLQKHTQKSRRRKVAGELPAK